MRFSVLVLGIAALSTASPVCASEDVERLLELLRPQDAIEKRRQAFEVGARAINEQLLSQMTANWKDELPDSFLEVFERESRKFMTAAQPTWKPERAIAKYRELLEANYSSSEIRDLIEFYESPTGRKFSETHSAIEEKWEVFFTEFETEPLMKAMAEFQEALLDAAKTAGEAASH